MRVYIASKILIKYFFFGLLILALSLLVDRLQAQTFTVSSYHCYKEETPGDTIYCFDIDQTGVVEIQDFLTCISWYNTNNFEIGDFLALVAQYGQPAPQLFYLPDFNFSYLAFSSGAFFTSPSGMYMGTLIYTMSDEPGPHPADCNLVCLNSFILQLTNPMSKTLYYH